MPKALSTEPKAAPRSQTVTTITTPIITHMSYLLFTPVAHRSGNVWLAGEYQLLFVGAQVFYGDVPLVSGGVID